MDFVTDLSLISVVFIDVSLIFPVPNMFLTVQLNKERQLA